ncbi:MAG: alpha/beta fold hydrolase, partial [Verrucomicrobiota bacterium]
MESTRSPKMTSHAFHLTLVLLGALAFASCTAPIRVQEVPPPSGYKATASSLASLTDEIYQAMKGIERGDASAIAIYNERLARLMESINQSSEKIEDSKLRVDSPGGIGHIRIDAPMDFEPPTATLVPVDTVEFQGKYAEHESIVEGIGAPVVGVKSTERIGFERMRKYRPIMTLTALLRFEGRDAVLQLVDPYQVETVTIAGRRRTLAADFSSGPMYGLSKGRIDRLGFDRLINPSKFSDTTQLNFLQPYDPDRIPVLMVHGLDSTPATWAPKFFALQCDPEIRKHYQFWVFSYPSGFPYPYSASLLRKQLNEVHQEFPDHKDIVLFGHSMGCLVSRLMITDVGDELWTEILGKPPEETNIPGKSRQLLEESFIFHHDERISRVVFFSGPHRGSVIASKPIVQLANRLVRIPNFMADVRNAVASTVTVDGAAFTLKRAPSSVDTLSPENPFVKAINKFPIESDIPFHSVMGDRGKGDTP